ncbi:diacylglycerol kinase [Trinickia terrae]|nr:diacylglycerol kinase [Trinickia terrae]
MTRGTTGAKAQPMPPATPRAGRPSPDAASRDGRLAAEPFGDPAPSPPAHAVSTPSPSGAIMTTPSNDTSSNPPAAPAGHAPQVTPMRLHLSDSHDSADAHEPLGPDDPLAPLPFNPYKGNRGITRAWHALKNSLNGFRVAIREESAFRQELTLTAILVPCGMFVPVDAVSHVLLLGSVLLVLIVELLNSSVEAAIDRISLERHELSKRAKDLGSAAVMVALFVCVMTWVLIVGPLVVRWTGHWIGR